MAVGSGPLVNLTTGHQTRSGVNPSSPARATPIEVLADLDPFGPKPLSAPDQHDYLRIMDDHADTLRSTGFLLPQEQEEPPTLSPRGIRGVNPSHYSREVHCM
jgi:hypothetical protein